MVANKNSLSFGRYLKAARLAKEIDLKNVSAETKIGINYLLLIEKEDHDRLPAEVFVKGFLRAYAQAIEADGDEVVKRYLESRLDFQETEDFDADLRRSDQAYWPRLFLSLGVLSGIIVLSVIVISLVHNRPSGDNSELQVPDKIHRDTSPKDLQVSNFAVEKREQTAEKMLLKIVGVDKTWLKIEIDGQSAREYSLKSGDLLELEASSGYNLLIGNAAGVQVTLNGKPVEILGKSGQVVNLQIP
ncbi:MAG: RodZ domain-containing protein [Candidatus Desulfatibia sp.]|uniref:helix-turn-helix domain-containing protein n=1 Tax=Candidatus Desulfatibia sp. TaxID=3101189 RepID=UPI002F32C38E